MCFPRCDDSSGCYGPSAADHGGQLLAAIREPLVLWPKTVLAPTIWPPSTVDHDLWKEITFRHHDCFNGRIQYHFMNSLDDTSQLGVKGFQVFDSKSLQYWFFHAQSSIQIVLREFFPFFNKEVKTWQLVQLNGSTMQISIHQYREEALQLALERLIDERKVAQQKVIQMGRMS